MPELGPTHGARVPAQVELDWLPSTMEEARLIVDSTARALKREARKARQPVSIVSGGAGRRGRKGERAFRLGMLMSFFLLVCGPLVAESVYWGAISSKQYATELKFALRAGQASPLDSLGGLFGLGTSQQAQDTQIVATYITSRAMVEALDKKFNLRVLYSDQSADYFSRIDSACSIEDLVKFWNKRIDVKVETLSGIVDVNIRTFKPEDAFAIGNEILILSEELVNDLSSRARRDALSDSRTMLDRAESRLQAATARMRDVRNTEGVVDAKAAAEALDKVVGALRLEKARLEQDIAGQPKSATDGPSVRILKSRLTAVSKQIDDYVQQIASVQSVAGGTMADRLGELSRAQVELDFARQQYNQASAAFQAARVNVESQQAYLVTALRPTLAQESTYPRRWWEWSKVVIPSLLFWALAAAAALIVRDNMAK